MRDRRSWQRRLLLRLWNKGLGYWITAAVIFFISIAASSKVYDLFHLANARAVVFQLLLKWPRPTEPKAVKLVLIKDEYWQSPMNGRRPINRGYLATVVQTLVAANAHIIALDFDTRLPDPDSLTIPEEYRKETILLIKEIKKAARAGKKVILATPISFNEEQEYRRDSDIYQAFGLCSRAAAGLPEDSDADPVKRNVTCGYIALPFDPLAVPGQLLLADGSHLNSFALALAKAGWPQMLSLQHVGRKVLLSNFISEKQLTESKVLFSSRDLLNAMDDNKLEASADKDRREAIILKERLQGAAVIVGGAWHIWAAGRGSIVDTHWTPAGRIVGAALQANFVEALLDTRTFGNVPDEFLRGMEVVLAVSAAIIFASAPNLWKKLYWIISFALFVVAIQWLFLHLFYVFFDALVPLLGLGIHSLFDRIVEPHNKVKPRRKRPTLSETAGD
jgi:CHASE2 domain-containing sensor protein